ncbi:hypothetical protein ACJX0J_017294, partial [Zea mays]
RQGGQEPAVPAAEGAEAERRREPRPHRAPQKGSGGSPAGAEDEGWHLHPHGGHRNVARVEHAVQVLAQQQEQNVSAGEHRGICSFQRASGGGFHSDLLRCQVGQI